MFVLFTKISTWLIIELIATLLLILLNLIIPLLMFFSSFRNLVNFYFSCVALSSSLLNCLYLYYLAQTLQSKILSENNCRAIYYLQTSCIVVLAYTITAMHANFILWLFPKSNRSYTSQTCLQCCGACLRRFFRRLCFCLVLCIWSLSFTSTIPLLYSIDSNEKSPKPVYCPGTTQISYLEEWFDRNRLVQTVIFNFIPLFLTLLLSLIALLKLLLDFLQYLYLRLKRSKYSSCFRQIRRPPSASIDQQNPMHSSVNLSATPTSETTEFAADRSIPSCAGYCSTAFLRFLLVLSCCLLACIYPIAMRFYLIYFSVLVPLIFTVMNYSFGQSTPILTDALQNSDDVTLPVNRPTVTTTTAILSSNETSNSLSNNVGRHLSTGSSAETEVKCSPHEQFELRSPLILNLLPEQREEGLETVSSSSQSSMTTSSQTHRKKPKYFTNHLYENTRNIFRR